jgi:hypothetical protein
LHAAGRQFLEENREGKQRRRQSLREERGSMDERRGETM